MCNQAQRSETSHTDIRKDEQTDKLVNRVASLQKKCKARRVMKRIMLSKAPSHNGKPNNKKVNK